MTCPIAPLGASDGALQPAMGTVARSIEASRPLHAADSHVGGRHWAAGDVWPLVGRDDEMDLIGEALASGRAGAIVLAGNPGVGKTRLVRETLELAAARGAATEWVTATPASASIPFGAFVHLVSTAGADRDRFALFEAVTAALAERAAGRQLVVGVDDAHALDDCSAALLFHLVMSGRGLVAATVRTGRRCPDPVVALWKDDFGLRLEVQPLSYEEVVTLLEAVLGSPLEHTSGRRLFEVSQGNVLFLRELVLAGLDSGGLSPREGLWWCTGNFASSRLQDLVEARLVGLAGAERRCVELIALGEPLALDILQECVDDDVVRASEQRGVVEVDLDAFPPLARLSHPLYGSVLRQMMARATRRARWRELASALRTRGAQSSDDAVRLATWLLGAGETSDPKVCTEAAQEASASCDHPLAVRLATAAVTGGGGLPAVLALATAATALGRPVEAEDLLARWEPVAHGDPAGAFYLRRRTAVLHRGLGRTDEAFALLERSGPWRVGAHWRTEIEALRLRLLVEAGRFQEVVEHGEALLDEPGCDAETTLSVKSSMGLALVQLGRIEAGLAVAGCAEPLSPAAQRAGPWALAVRFSALFEQGRWVHLQALVDAIYDEAVHHGDGGRVAVAGYLVGCVRLARGSLTGAHRSLREALGHFQVSDPEGFRGSCLAQLAYAAALSGDASAASGYHQRAVAAVRVDSWWERFSLALADVWTAVASGEVSLAQQKALERADECGEQPLSEAHLLHEALRVGCKAGVVLGRLQSISERVETPLTAAYAAHAAARAETGGEGLDAVAARFEGFGANLLAAEAAAEASVAHQAAGRKDMARRSMSVSVSLAAACDPALTPALARPSYSALTTREREVAGLAARGHTNADIAQRLGLSVRTVESHLYRAAYKLGVNPRAGVRAIPG
jgi:DNA-binding CsgD family transcriptional regulator